MVLYRLDICNGPIGIANPKPQTPNPKRIIFVTMKLLCERNPQPFERIEPPKPLFLYPSFTDTGNSKTNVEPTSTVLLT